MLNPETWKRNDISQTTGQDQEIASDFLPVATFLITGVSCVSLFGLLFAATR